MPRKYEKVQIIVCSTQKAVQKVRRFPASVSKSAEQKLCCRASESEVGYGYLIILKTECIYRSKPATRAEAKKLIDDYIYFYNNQRIQTKTKLTPLELRCQYVA